MMRKILCNYDFTYQGITYDGMGIYLGDTTNPQTIRCKDYSLDIVCLAMRRTQEDIARMTKCHYWDVTRAKLEEIGIVFHQQDIYFYPPIK